jgi:hydrogenase maturation protease
VLIERIKVLMIEQSCPDRSETLAKNTIIVGLGNPLFCDVSIGLLVARSFKKIYPFPGVSVIECSVAGTDVVEIISGYHKAIIIDAIVSGQVEPGTIIKFELDENLAPYQTFPHNFDFLTALVISKKIGIRLPSEICVFAIEAQNVTEMKHICTPHVASAIPICVSKIFEEIKKDLQYTG